MMKCKTDMELLDAVRNGSVPAFEELYRRHASLLYSNILARVKTSFDADDLFQSFLESFWNKRQDIHVNGSVKAYLLAWVRHHVLNCIREEQIRGRFDGELVLDFDREKCENTWEGIVAGDLKDRIQRLVEMMPARLRQVYRLSREQHLTVKEIAAQEGVSEQTVKNQLVEVMRRLRKDVRFNIFLFFLIFYSTIGLRDVSFI